MILKSMSRNFVRFTHFETPKYETMFCGIAPVSLNVYMYLCTREHACAPERLDGFYLYYIYIYIIVSVICRYAVNMKNSAPKICALKMGPQNRFPRKGSNDFE